VWSFSGRPDLKVKVRLIHRSLRFCIMTTSILMGATYTRVRLIVEILRYTRYSIYAVARNNSKNHIHTMYVLSCCQTFV